jgi:Putative mono-oxygenase ydhR
MITPYFSLVSMGCLRVATQERVAVGSPDARGGDHMYAACFRFALPEGTDVNAIRTMMKAATAQFRNLPGLRSKAFLLDVDHREIGGNYVWETRESLDAYLRSDLYVAVVRKLGEPKELRIYEVPEYVDNAHAQIESSFAQAA